MYGNTNHNVSLAMTRLTKTRLPSLVGYERFMQEKQHTFLEENQPFLQNLRGQYESTFYDYYEMIDECEIHHDDPHIKKALRICAWKDILTLNLLYEPLWYLPGKGTEYKMKIFEIAKPGKVPRMIGDLGVHASLQGFRLTYFMKKAMADNPVAMDGGVAEYCPTPDPSKLEAVFDKLITPPGRFYFVLFSDDSCLSIRTPTGILRFNVDISSCDASHTGALFTALRSVFPADVVEQVDQLIDQCQTDITVYDRFNKRRCVVLKPKDPRLYSGSTLTTIINNLANILIAKSISTSNIQSAQDVIDAAARVGYIVTCEDCSDWHQLQFLKHSPVRCHDGVIRPLLNIGVLLRLTGTSKGDLPGSKKTPLRDRCMAFQASLLRGAYPKARFTLIDNLRASAGVPNPACDRIVASMMAYKVMDDDDYPVFHVSSDEVWARYNLTPLEVAEVEDDFGRCCTYTHHFQSTGTDKILKSDYGLSGADFPSGELESTW